MIKKQLSIYHIRRARRHFIRCVAFAALALASLSPLALLRFGDPLGELCILSCMAFIYAAAIQHGKMVVHKKHIVKID